MRRSWVSSSSLQDSAEKVHTSHYSFVSELVVSACAAEAHVVVVVAIVEGQQQAAVVVVVVAVGQFAESSIATGSIIFDCLHSLRNATRGTCSASGCAMHLGHQRGYSF